MILALDLGVTTGWAAGERGSVPTWGAVQLPGPTAARGARWCGLSEWLADAIDRHTPTAIVKEAPLRFAGQNNATIARGQFALHAAVEETCYRAGFDVAEVDVNVARKAVLGRARWPHGTDPKVEVRRWLNAHNFAVTQPDAADALVIWIWACDYFEVIAKAVAAASA